MEFSVSDTGSGIKPDELPFIFDRFQRGDQSRHADGNESGLGLAIVKALVEAHRGTVSAESAVGHGTTIRVWFPNTI
jgi:signal transduction histidine kinase